MPPIERLPKADGMTFMIAVLILGAVASPPPDEDQERSKPIAPALAIDAPGQDDERARAAGPAQSQATADADEEEEGVRPDDAIVVTARRLDTARTQTDAGLGATVYSLTNETIENRPGGETGSISQILTQAPGATVSVKGLNIRGSRANQVRINNVIVPEAIADPADHLSSRLAETTRLITGTLPAQFGFAPAGVISVTTKNGLYQHGGQAELFASSDRMLEPALEWAGSANGTSLFASGSLERDRSNVADGEGAAARDRRNEIEGLAFADHVVGENDRVSLLVGGSRERHRIGQTTIGAGTERSSDGYAVATYLHSQGGLTVQSSLFVGSASDQSLFIVPTHERHRSFGIQVDASDAVSTSHTLRFGLLASRSTVRELDLASERSVTGRTSAAVYAQDEWKIAPTLTFNPGARVEWLRGGSSGATVEPRASLVWENGSGLTGHVGYARYASAAPLGEQVAATKLPDERDDYLDMGMQKRAGPFTFGLDGYWRSVRNDIAEREAIGSAVPAAFALRRARIKGVEFAATYSHRATTAWANLAFASAKGRSIIGGEALFSPDILFALSQRSVPLASERPVTASGGFTRRLGKISLSGDLLVSSGAVRTLNAARPNGARYSPYAVVGLAAVYHARIAGRSADLRFDFTNLTNARYFTSNAANLEGGWTRRERGRAITIGIEQGF
ncbi:MAG: TonB-dependent receptor [Sphingomicrobium sp.]